MPPLFGSAPVAGPERLELPPAAQPGSPGPVGSRPNPANKSCCQQGYVAQASSWSPHGQGLWGLPSWSCRREPSSSRGSHHDQRQIDEGPGSDLSGSRRAPHRRLAPAGRRRAGLVAGAAAICSGSADQGGAWGGAPRRHGTGKQSDVILEASNPNDRSAYKGPRDRWLAITQRVKPSRFSCPLATASTAASAASRWRTAQIH